MHTLELEQEMEVRGHVHGHCGLLLPGLGSFGSCTYVSAAYGSLRLQFSRRDSVHWRLYLGAWFQQLSLVRILRNFSASKCRKQNFFC